MEKMKILYESHEDSTLLQVDIKIFSLFDRTNYPLTKLEPYLDFNSRQKTLLVHATGKKEMGIDIPGLQFLKVSLTDADQKMKVIGSQRINLVSAAIHYFHQSVFRALDFFFSQLELFFKEYDESEKPCNEEKSLNTIREEDEKKSSGLEKIKEAEDEQSVFLTKEEEEKKEKARKTIEYPQFSTLEIIGEDLQVYLPFSPTSPSRILVEVQKLSIQSIPYENTTRVTSGQTKEI